MSALSDRVRPYTMVTGQRLADTERLLRDVLAQGVLGDVLEAGVWHGGCLALMALAAPDRDAWGLDSFRGLSEPEPWERSQYPCHKGACRCSREDAERALADLGCGDRVRLVEGWLADTLPALPPFPLAFLRLDLDLYAPTRLALAYLYPMLSDGGIVYLDDYGCFNGCRRAADEYRAERGIAAEITWTDTEGVWWVKT